MVSPELRAAFQKWTNGALARPLPPSVVAFNFNLYETTSGVDVDLIGSDAYSQDDNAWAQREVFAAREPVFRIPQPLAGSWQQSLALAIDLVKGYLAENHQDSEVLRHAQAITVGFVDGDLERVWPPAV